MKAEIIKASVNKNGTLGEIKTLGPNVAEIPIQYDKATKKPTLGKNSFHVKCTRTRRLPVTNRADI